MTFWSINNDCEPFFYHYTQWVQKPKILLVLTYTKKWDENRYVSCKDRNHYRSYTTKFLAQNICFYSIVKENHCVISHYSMEFVKLQKFFNNFNKGGNFFSSVFQMFFISRNNSLLNSNLRKIYMYIFISLGNELEWKRTCILFFFKKYIELNNFIDQRFSLQANTTDTRILLWGSSAIYMIVLWY